MQGLKQLRPTPFSGRWSRTPFSQRSPTSPGRPSSPITRRARSFIPPSGVSSLSSFPRASFTLVDPRTGRLLDKYEIDVDDVWQGSAHLAERIAALSLSPGWQDRLEKDDREIALVLERLQSEVRGIDPTLLDAVEHTHKSIAGQIEKLKGKITRSAFAGSEVPEPAPAGAGKLSPARRTSSRAQHQWHLFSGPRRIRCS